MRRYASQNGNLDKKRKRGISYSFNRNKIYTFNDDTAAFFVPVELRRIFRKLSNINEELRPNDSSVLQTFFSRCAIVSPHFLTGVPQIFNEAYIYSSKERTNELNIKTKNKKISCVLEGIKNPAEYLQDCCIIWTKNPDLTKISSKKKWMNKLAGNFMNRAISNDNEQHAHNRPSCVERNKNLYFWINEKNVHVRRLMFEWFIGPTNLSKEEKQKYSKRRGTQRKRPRQLKQICSSGELCINPFHLKSTPIIDDSTKISLLNEKRGIVSLPYVKYKSIESDEDNNDGDGDDEKKGKNHTSYHLLHKHYVQSDEDIASRKKLITAQKNSFYLLGIEKK